MTEKEQQDKGLDGLINDLQVFIDLSFHGDDLPLQEWIEETINKLDNKCWEKMHCTETSCPAYQNECGRCWLIAGTMCGGKVQGKFVDKYGSCTSCTVYRETIGHDRVRRLRELVIALIHSLRLRQRELMEAKSEIKILSGFLPICMSCKKIRDDNGQWFQMEFYIHQHSEAKFSHGICPECIKKLYPGYAERKNRDR